MKDRYSGKKNRHVDKKPAGKKPAKKRPVYKVVAAQPHHGRGVYETICLANTYDPSGHISGVFGLKEWGRLLSRFPEGQLVAVSDMGGEEKVIGIALSLRTNHTPSAKPLSWYEVIGDLTLANHDPTGSWLYGVEKAVHPEFQGLGVGSALYRAQFALVEKLELEGIVAAGCSRVSRATNTGCRSTNTPRGSCAARFSTPQ